MADLEMLEPTVVKVDVPAKVVTKCKGFSLDFGTKLSEIYLLSLLNLSRVTYTCFPRRVLDRCFICLL